MTDVARLVLTADTSGLKEGESALDSIARTGTRVEGKLTISASSIERAMAQVGQTIVGLNQTMKSLEAAVTGSIGKAAQSVKSSARSFDDLRRSIDPVYAASQRFAEVQGELAGMVARGEASQRAANDVLEQAASRYMGVATAAERAEQAQQEQAAAISSATTGYQGLLASVDSVYVSSKRYEAAQEQLTAAVNAGVISEQERDRVLGLAAARYLSVGEAAQTAAMKQVSASRAVDGATRASTMNLMLNFQDVAMMMASGQNPFMLAMQQGTQISGVLEGMRGRVSILRLIGSAFASLISPLSLATLGIIGFGSAAVQWLFSASDAADGAASSTKKLRPAAEEAMSALGTVRSAMGEVEAATKRYNDAISVSQSLRGADFGSYLGLLSQELSARRDILAVEQARMELRRFELQESIAAGKARIEALFTEMRLSEETYLAAQKGRMGEQEMAAFKAEQLAKVKSIVEENQSIFLSQREQNATLKLINAALDQATGEYEKQAKAASTVAATVDEYRRQADIQDAIWKYGADSLRVEILRYEQARGLVFAKAEELDLTEAQTRELVAAFDATNRVAAAASWLRGVLISAADAASGLAAQLANAARQLPMVGGLVDMITKGAGDAATAVGSYLGGAVDAVRVKIAQYEASLKGAGRAAGKGDKGAADAIDELAKEVERLNKVAAEGLTPVERYRKAMEKLDTLRAKGLSDGAYSQELERINDELAKATPIIYGFSDAFGGFLEGSISSFKDFAGSILGTFRKLLADMIVMALRNKILIPMALGVSGGGIVGTAANALGGFGGLGSGLLGGAGSLGGGLLGTIGGFAGGIGSGFQAALGLGGFSSAGVFNVAANAATAVAAGASGFAAAIGAAIPIIGAVGVLFSALKGKTKLLDAGIRVTVDEMDSLVQTFSKTKKSRLFGLISSTKTKYKDADDELADPVSQAISTIQGDILKMAGVLGVGASAFDDFSYRVSVSTKGLSDDEALKAVEEAISGVSDAFAGMVHGLGRFSLDGESVTDTLRRLSASLLIVNQAFDTLGYRAKYSGIGGAGAAAGLVGQFGGADGFSQATGVYYQAFYSEAERLATATRQVGAAMRDLGMPMPKTREEFRRLVDAQNLATASGRAMWASLVGLSSQMDAILPAAGSLRDAFAAMKAEMVSGAVSAIDKQISASRSMAQAARLSATEYARAADSLRASIAQIGEVRNRVDFRALGADFNALFRKAMSGDKDALGSLGSAGQNLASEGAAFARSRQELIRFEASIRNRLGRAEGLSSTLGGAADYQARLYDVNAAALENLRDLLQSGEATQAEIRGQTGVLNRLGTLIAQSAGIQRAAPGMTAEAIAAKVALGNADLRDGIVGKLDSGATVIGIDKLVAGNVGIVSALGDILSLWRAEARRRDHERRSESLSDFISNLARDGRGRVIANDSQIGRMAGIAGISTDKLTTAQIIRRLVGFDNADALTGIVPTFASGGLHSGGFAVVGEQGPELVNMGPSRVWNAGDTKAMLNGDDGEIARLREDIAELRRVLVEVVKHVKRSSDTLRTWNANGLPEERAAE